MNSMLDFAKSLLLLLLVLALVLSTAVRSCLLPFVIALLLAALANRPISRLAQHLPRWLAALLIYTIGGLLLICLLLLLAVKLWQDIPAALSGFSGLSGSGSLWSRLETLANGLPSFLRGGTQWLLGQLQSQSSTLSAQLTAALTEWATNWAAALPGWLFTLGVTLLASFYAAADWTRVKSGLSRLLPAGWRDSIRTLLNRLKQGAFGWLRVQGRLMGITFLLLAGGFLLLRIPGACMVALLIALADALPVFGSGVLLVPWAVLVLFQGQHWLSLGLLLLWLAATVCRSVLEPRFLGKQAGVSPLVTLLVMYAGLRFFGLVGLILGPIALSAGMAVLDSPE